MGVAKSDIFFDWSNIMAVRNEKGQFVKGKNIHDLTGERYGNLVVLSLAEIKDKRSYWNCQCDCGNRKIVRNDALISYKTVSCGCLKKKQDRINLTAYHKGGRTKERLYHIWMSMRQRCQNPNNHAYLDYGGRGITVSPLWEDYDVFKKWAYENGYDDLLTIERKDVNGNYEPDNCCWIPCSLQARNTRKTVYFDFDKKEHPMVEWSEITGIKRGTLYARFRKGYTNKADLLSDVNLRTGRKLEVVSR